MQAHESYKLIDKKHKVLYQSSIFNVPEMNRQTDGFLSHYMDDSTIYGTPNQR
jgi:hypothetical protein